MTKTLRKIIIVASILAIAIVSTISFAAWSSSTSSKAGNTITIGSADILEFDNATAVTIASILPYNQVTGWTANKNYGTMDFVVNQTTTAVNFDITVSNYVSTLDVASKIKYSLTDPTSQAAAAAVTDVLANGKTFSGTTSTAGTTTITVYFWLESVAATDTGETVTFDVTVTQAP